MRPSPQRVHSIQWGPLTGGQQASVERSGGTLEPSSFREMVHSLPVGSVRQLGGGQILLGSGAAAAAVHSCTTYLSSCPLAVTNGHGHPPPPLALGSGMHLHTEGSDRRKRQGGACARDPKASLICHPGCQWHLLLRPEIVHLSYSFADIGFLPCQ